MQSCITCQVPIYDSQISFIMRLSTMLKLSIQFLKRRKKNNPKVEVYHSFIEEKKPEKKHSIRYYLSNFKDNLVRELPKILTIVGVYAISVPPVILICGPILGTVIVVLFTGALLQYWWHDQCDVV